MSLYDDADELFREVSKGGELLKEEAMLNYLRGEGFTAEEASGILQCFQYDDSRISLQAFRKGYLGFIGKMSSLRKFVAAREKDDALLARGFDLVAVEQCAGEFLDGFIQTEALEIIDSLMQSYWQDRLEEKGYSHQSVIEVFMLIQGEIAAEYVREIVEKEVKILARDIELRITSLLVDKGIKEQMTHDARDDVIDDVLHEYLHSWCSDYVHATTTLCKTTRRRVARSNYFVFRENALAMEKAQRVAVKDIVEEIIFEEATQIAAQVYRDEIRKEALESAAETIDTLLEQSSNQVKLNAQTTIPLVVADFYDHFYKFWRTWKTRTVEEAAQKVLDEMQEKEWRKKENEETNQIESRLALSEGKTDVEQQNWSEHLDSAPQVAQEKSKKPLPGGKEWVQSEFGRQWIHTFTEGQMADQGQDTIQRLKGYLASSSAADRIDAVRTLAIAVRGGNPDLILLYGSLARDEDKDVRRLSLHALRMAMDAGYQQAEEALVLTLQHDDRHVRLGGLEMLRERALAGSNPVITALVWQQNDPADDVRRVVQGLVAECAVRGNKKALYGLGLMLSDTKDTSSWLAFHPQLRELCKNGHTKLTKSEIARKQAVQILGGCTEDMGPGWTAVFGDLEAGFAPLASTWQSDPRRWLWEEILSSLSRKCSEKAEKKEEVRRAALAALTVPIQHGHTETLQVVVRALRHDPSPKVRHQAAKLLQCVPESAAASIRSAIINGVSDEAAIVREVCVVSLSGLCSLPKVRKAMLDAAVNDNSRYVRQEALAALHLGGHTDDIDLLRRLIWRLRDFGEDQNQDIIEVLADAVCVNEGRETVTRPPLIPDEKELEGERAADAKKQAEEEEKRKKEENERLGVRLSSFADDDSDDRDDDDRQRAELYRQLATVQIDPEDNDDDEVEDTKKRGFLPAKSVPADTLETRIVRNARRRSTVAEGAVVSLLLKSTRDRQPNLRRAALKVLSLSQSGLGEAAFTSALQDSDTSVRLTAVGAINTLLQTKYHKLSVGPECLTIDDQDANDSAMEVEGGWTAARQALLAKAAEQKDLEDLALSLLKVVHSDSSDAVRAAALADLTSPDDLSLCVKGLIDNDPSVRAAAVHKAAVILDTLSNPSNNSASAQQLHTLHLATSQRTQAQELQITSEKRPETGRQNRPGTTSTRPGTSADRPTTGADFGDSGAWSRLEVRAETADSAKSQARGAVHVLQMALSDTDSEVKNVASSALALRPDNVSVSSSG